MAAHGPMDHCRTGPLTAERRYGREDRAPALGACAILDLEVGRPSFEDGRDRVRDGSRDRVLLLAVGLEQIASDRDSGEGAFAVVGRPRVISPGDISLEIQHGDRASL